MLPSHVESEVGLAPFPVARVQRGLRLLGIVIAMPGKCFAFALAKRRSNQTEAFAALVWIASPGECKAFIRSPARNDGGARQT
jgi:hypothetical protein